MVVAMKMILSDNPRSIRSEAQLTPMHPASGGVGGADATSVWEELQAGGRAPIRGMNARTCTIGPGRGTVVGHDLGEEIRVDSITLPQEVLDP